MSYSVNHEYNRPVNVQSLGQKKCIYPDPNSTSFAKYLHVIMFSDTKCAFATWHVTVAAEASLCVMPSGMTVFLRPVCVTAANAVCVCLCRVGLAQALRGLHWA